MKNNLSRFILYIFLWLVSSNVTRSQPLEVEEPVRFLALGDSYTIGQSVPSNESWPLQLFDSLDLKGYYAESYNIIARTGWRTDNLMKAINEAELENNYNLVSLLIGVNNQFQGFSVEEYASEFETLLQTAIELAGGARKRVIVLSIPDYGYTPYGRFNIENISKQVELFNKENRRITNEYQIKYYNITPISQEGLNVPSLVANDGLHPSGEMYSEWVQMILKDIPNKGVTQNQRKIEQPNNGAFLIYPNPASNYVSVRTEIQEPFRVSIFNLNGEVVFSGNFNNQEANILINPLESGLYFVLVEMGQKTYREKLIISR